MKLLLSYLKPYRGMIALAVILTVVNQSQSVEARLYADGIEHSLSFPYRAFEDTQSGAILQSLQKVRSDSRDMIGHSINTIFLSSLTFLLVLGYSFLVH